MTARRLNEISRRAVRSLRIGHADAANLFALIPRSHSMRNREIEQRVRDAAAHAGDVASDYVDSGKRGGQNLLERGRRRLRQGLGQRGRGYGRQFSHAAEDFADEANYQYRRMRRQVSRHPAATIAIVAGTIGAFLLLRQVFRNDED
jgi:hypothetical protein